jgi:hypothetical protein
MKRPPRNAENGLLLVTALLTEVTGGARGNRAGATSRRELARTFVTGAYINAESLTRLRGLAAYQRSLLRHQCYAEACLSQVMIPIGSRLGRLGLARAPRC